ncbi:hypothetical protein H6G27_22685 [Nostoc linckia FACHB-104]|nr:hypothetical protein [Nostoc linckia FACHB-104]
MQQIIETDRIEIENNINLFKAVLKDKSNTDKLIVQKYIIHGTPYIFKNNEDKYFNLKHEIARHFNENPANLHMVGSGKLSFSIAPKKLWNPFSDTSDIDMAIISQRIFENFWSELYDFNILLKSRTENEQKLYNRFLKNFFKGWIRPDLFPFGYPGKNKWLDYCRSISYKFSEQKVNCAIYYNFDFFEKYHISNINKLRQEEITNE